MDAMRCQGICRRLIEFARVALISLAIPSRCFAEGSVSSVSDVLSKVREYAFHPLNSEETFTNDRDLGTAGIANLDCIDGKVRMLAVRDLLRALPASTPEIEAALSDNSLHVRQIAAMALGIAGIGDSAPKLRRLLRSDASALVRSQAAISLGQLQSQESLSDLESSMKNDTSRDVGHFCELALGQIRKSRGVTDDLRHAYLNLSENEFETVGVGTPSPDFVLKDTDGKSLRLLEHNRGHWTLLIWIFADWCPVCHKEFSDLLVLEKEFAAANVEVTTIECHDVYQCRVMVGKEANPTYWFAKKPFSEKYQSIWWPHLCDLAGAVGARYGVDPMSFAVHGEYINRPTTVVIDPQGIVRFSYIGTFWGDRPTIHQTLEMIKRQNFDFEHPDRRVDNQSR